MLADTGYDDGGSLTLCLGSHNGGHRLGVRVVEMRDGVVGKQEVEWLDEGAYHGHALLLPEAHKADGRLHLVGNAESLEPLLYLFSRLEVRQVVLYLDVLHCRKLGEEP